MQGSRFRDSFKRAYARYDRIMEKQGFYIVLGVCVLVIVLSALYTFYLRDETGAAPDSADTAAQSAAGSDAQSLKDAQALIASQNAAQPLALPTESAFRLTQPLEGFLERAFNDTEPQYFEQSSMWQVHTGIDLQAEYGALVAACASGKIASVWQDNELGLCITIDHQNGYETLYAGLSDASYVKAGDPISRGQTIGHVGSGVLSEGSDNPHLHLEARRDGRPIDPLLLFLGVDK